MNDAWQWKGMAIEELLHAAPGDEPWLSRRDSHFFQMRLIWAA